MPARRSTGPSSDRSRPRVTRVFLFTDLRDYTRFVEAQGDLAATRLLTDYRTIVRREVGRTSGAEIKTEGDSFYIVFESAGPALDCAIAILRRVRAHNERHAGRQLRVGAGLHAGDAVAYDGQYVGGAVIVASRLSTSAAGGELLVSDTVRGLVRTGQGHVWSDRGDVLLKGVSEPIHAWRVDIDEAPRSATIAGPPPLASADLHRLAPAGKLVCPVLVGRDGELAQVRAIFTAVKAGHGGIIFISGEPGIGKSAFVREAAGAATELGFRSLAGVARQWESGLPYAPFLSALRSGFPGPALREVVAQLAPDVMPLLPELGRAATPIDSPLERHRIARAFSELFAGLSAQASLLVVLEDLHWVDEASIALLQHLARQLEQRPIAVLVTYRSDDVGRRHPLTTLVNELVRSGLGTAMRLDPLDATRIGQLIDATLAAGVINDNTRQAIYARSEGNPLFAEELLVSLVDAGAVVHHDGVGWQQIGAAGVLLPETLRELVLARLERLPPSTLATLAAAAVIGVRVPYATLRSVRGVDEARLTEDLRQTVDEQLLVEDADGRRSAFEFRHALTREVIYDDLLLPERQRLHLLVAQALVNDGEAAPAVVAPHWSAGGDRAHSAAAYESAGNAALAVNAASEAVGHFEAAITASDGATAGHYLGLARAYLTFDHQKARLAAERGMRLLGSGEQIATRVDLMRIAGRARWLMGDAAGNLKLAEAAVGLIQQEADSRAKADAFEWFAHAEVTHGDAAAAAPWASRALDVARSVGARATVANALITAAACEAVRSPSAALALVDEAAAVARGAHAAEALARAHADGIAYSFQVETERRRFVRIERAMEFGRRYGYAGRQFTAYQAFHAFVAGEWPPIAELEPVDDPDAGDLYTLWRRSFHALIGCARRGPNDDRVGAIDAFVTRAVHHGEPQWAIPALSYAALAANWAGHGQDLRHAIDSMLAIAGGTGTALRSLTVFNHGYPASSVALFLAGERDRLGQMFAALADFDGNAGERELIGVLIASLDGAPIEPAMTMAADTLGRRGLAFGSALAAWALATREPRTALPSNVEALAAGTLRRAGATWLLDGLAARDDS